mgnify:FL=1
MTAGMTGSIKMIAGGRVAALAVVFFSFDAAAARLPPAHDMAEITAGRAAPRLPQRARLIRLPDQRSEEPARALGRTVPEAVAGLAALVALWTLWQTRPQRSLGRTAGKGALQVGA